MSKGHTAVNLFLENKARYADFFNGNFFQGRQIVLPEELEVINKRLESFFEFGYSPEVLGPLVDVMCEYNRKLEELEKQES